ncbi:unnamed protein product [Phytophthora lilii]|uniref:Unnamed protein product n=1 Tax=Phytophthora lilii TaxID=2077276 RepID=A0A9W6YH96_9STRA|nr:unnamed protein product [Phytophthora lilii]
MVLGKASLTATVATAMLAATVQGHGYMSVPKVEFTFIGDTTQYMATIDAGKSGFSGTFGGSPADNTANFNKAFSSSKYSSLKDFMNDKMVLVNNDFTKECGYTNPKETPQPVPETYVEWSHGSGEGFTPSHEGPCEVWCDDTRVFQNDNCPANYLYINCAALEKTTSTGAKSKFAVGGSSGGTTGSSSTTPATDSSSSEQTTDAPSSEQTTDAPTTPTTDAPSAEQTTDAPSNPTADTPIVTEAPATDSPVVTPAPNTSDDTSKCSVRRHRRRRN